MPSSIPDNQMPHFALYLIHLWSHCVSQ